MNNTEIKAVALTCDRMREAMNDRGMNQVDLADATGLNKSTISRYLTGAVEPKQKAIMALARALDVTEMWLWGYDVPKERTEEQKKNDDLAKAIAKMRKNPKYIDFMSKALQLSDADFDSVDRLLSSLVNK